MVYALLPDRKAPTYIHLFQILFAEPRKSDKTIDPVLFMTDSEPAMARAITLEVTLSSRSSSLSDEYLCSFFLVLGNNYAKGLLLSFLQGNLQTCALSWFIINLFK